MEVIVVGAGLAGSEIAYFLAERGIKVNLYEMRPAKSTPAHKTDKFAELVCSNSFRSIQKEHPAGILKNELELLNSIIIKTAKEFSIPGGNALTIDRERFSSHITQILNQHPNINIINQEFTELTHSIPVILATGPLTSDNLANNLRDILGEEHFYFYDAIAPIVEFDSIDMDHAFYGNRYNMENKDYINCPLNEEEYFNFIEALKTAKIFPYKDFEKSVHFEGCMPIEEMLSRGDLTLAYGPMKPVGLIDPKTGKQPYAVVQLRRENREGTAYNIVGFQTKMLIPEQERVFRLIPGLKNAKFLRYGSLHRNIYINAPEVLNDNLALKKIPNVYIAGQLSGVEGYIESVAQGILVAMIVYSVLKNFQIILPPQETAHGALYYFLREKKKKFVPSNINFSLFKYGEKIRKIRSKKKRKELLSKQAIEFFNQWINL
jgi:methylenetetrahydrofolate--tRNA-(uracil-5-)-methyltransferase